MSEPETELHMPSAGEEKSLVTGASRADRKTSFDVADFPMPTGREEEWRYTPLEDFAPLLDGKKLAGSGGNIDVSIDSAPGVWMEQVGRSDERLGKAPAPGDRIAALAWENFDEAAVISIPSAVKHPEASCCAKDGFVHTTVEVTGRSLDPIASHMAIIAEPDSQGAIVIDHTGDAVLSSNIEIIVEENAELTVVSVQRFNDTSVYASSQRARIATGGKLKHIVITLGGKATRITPEVEFDGPDGSVELSGLYLTDSGQTHEHRLYIDHDQPRCRSRATYKGALQGATAHSAWVGDVLIRPEAVGTDTYEVNRNLVLSKGAKADSVPNLEIETGNIEGAGHASATGRFDDEQLFYLMSRGVDKETAEKLVVHGFFAELIGHIGIPTVEKWLVSEVDAKLSTHEVLADAIPEQEMVR